MEYARPWIREARGIADPLRNQTQCTSEEAAQVGLLLVNPSPIAASHLKLRPSAHKASLQRVSAKPFSERRILQRERQVLKTKWF